MTIDYYYRSINFKRKKHYKNVDRPWGNTSKCYPEGRYVPDAKRREHNYPRGNILMCSPKGGQHSLCFIKFVNKKLFIKNKYAILYHSFI